MTPAFAFDAAHNCWVSKSPYPIRIDSNGIVIGIQEPAAIEWAVIDSLRPKVMPYPRPCSLGRLKHDLGMYGNGDCRKCGLSFEDIYGPEQIAKWKAEEDEQRKFECDCKQILQHLFRAGWVAESVDGMCIVYPSGERPTDLSVYRHTYVDFVFVDGFQKCRIDVPKDLVVRYGHLLNEPPPEYQKYQFGDVAKWMEQEKKREEFWAEAKKRDKKWWRWG